MRLPRQEFSNQKHEDKSALSESELRMLLNRVLVPTSDKSPDPLKAFKHALKLVEVNLDQLLKHGVDGIVSSLRKENADLFKNLNEKGLKEGSSDKLAAAFFLQDFMLEYNKYSTQKVKPSN